MRRLGLFAIAAFTTACVRLNPDFGDGAQAGGTAGGSRGDGGRTTSEPVTTGGRDEGSASGTGRPTSASSTTETTASSNPDDTTRGDVDETGPQDTSTTEADRDFSVIIFAAGPVQGQFATNGTLEESTAQRCSDAALSLGDGTVCGEAFGIVASSSYPYGAIAAEHPELLGLDLVAPDGMPVAPSFDALSKGDVFQHFATGVTAELAPQTTPTFWWGPSGDVQGDCQLWTVTNDEGRTLRFNPADSVIELDEDVSCQALQLLLCGCVPDR